MADMDVTALVLILCTVFQSIYGIEIEATPANGHDVAAGKMAFSDQINAQSDPGYAVDGNLTTCMETKRVRDTDWRVDLGAAKVVTGVAMIVQPGERLNSVEIYISNDPRGPGDVCKFSSLDGDTAYVTCGRPISGQYVLLQNLHSTGIRICELQVIECHDLYYGVDCLGECHCLTEGEKCDKVTGACPSGCAPGYHTANCSQVCRNNTFGANCAQQCHCSFNAQCDVEIGACGSGCARGWKGSDCQTQVPTITTAPEKVSSDSDKIGLVWPSWTGSISREFTVQYTVQYMEYYATEKNWLTGPKVDMNPNSEFQQATISKLKLNTYYKFRIRPSLLENGEVEEHGEWGPNSIPYKTKCIVPDPPTITELESGTDNARDPPSATLTVHWKKPPEEGIRCDNIAYYKIIYSKKSSEVWQNTKASQVSTHKRINELDFESVYLVMVVAVNNEEFDGRSDVEEIKTSSQFAVPGKDKAKGREDMGLIIAAVIIGLLVLSALILIIVVIYRYKFRRRKKARYATVPPKDDDAALGYGDITLHALTPLDKERTPTNDSGILVEASYKHTPSSSAESFTQIKDPFKPPKSPALRPKREHFAINLEELEDYVMQRRDKDSKELKSEYKEFPEGGQKPWEHGKSRENKHKNRFVNIIAYDHSRVILDVVEGDPDSDYINANYIDGYEKEKHFIASQGCNKWTTQDMWRMAWQENVLRIVMVTNLVESGKRKCEQYWPEHMNEDKPYGDITVTWIDTEQTSDFVIRTFQLKKGEESRNLKQFHFTAWPDHGVPTRAGPIIAFRRKVRSFDESHGGTNIIHCSAGVGRTGTYIAIDYLLEMAKAEKKIDLYNLTKRMRDQRVNMIQTEEQYVFVYDALLEALKTGDTAIPCSEFRMEFELLCRVESDTEEEEEEGVVQPQCDGKTKLQTQFENLQSVSPRITKAECQSGAEPDNIEKNRNQQILPADRHRPYLMTKVHGTNDYINAVFLDGYKSRNSHIITQMPLPHTVIDFWRMVHEHNVGSIVMLNSVNADDETMGQYWPDDVACECGPFVIEPMSVKSDENDVTVRELKLTFQLTSPTSGRKFGGPKERTVNLFQYMAWPSHSNVPQCKTSIMSLIDMVEKSQYKTGGGPVLIHCLDGASRSGLYAAISCIWEKMKLEQEVDIFHTVKHLRYHRPQVIQNLEQYKFCFEMVLAFLAEFETYANFTWKGNESPTDSD